MQMKFHLRKMWGTAQRPLFAYLIGHKKKIIPHSHCLERESSQGQSKEVV